MEINPLIVTASDEVLALDAKINFDDNSLAGHPEIAAWRDVYEEEPLEVEASKYELNYIRLEGNIGCMVNGAGLAMATMDVIKLGGARRLTFWMWAASSPAEKVLTAMPDPAVDEQLKAISSIFSAASHAVTTLVGGILIGPRSTGKFTVPMVIRLVGTNETQGRGLLQKAGLNSPHRSMTEAITQAVAQSLGGASS